MPPAPQPDNEAHRLDALRDCAVLDTAAEPAFDDLTRLASDLTGAPIALVSLVDADRQWFKSCVGLDAPQTPRDQAFCGYTILRDDTLVIPDASIDPRTADNPLVTGEPGIRFYAGVPLRLTTGEALGALCVIDTQTRDISDTQLTHLRILADQAASQLELRKRMTELEKASRESQRASQSKSMFLANMSHEIRTPMTAILGYADLILDPASNALDFTTHVATIKRNGEHLLTIINDILDMSKIEAGRMGVEHIDTDLVQIVRDVAELMGPRAQGKGVELRVEFQKPFPEIIKTDPTRIRQVLVNLVGNAIKFTGEGAVTLRCAIDEPEGAPPVASLTIRDTGVGMSPEQVENLSRFDPFSQADESTTRKFGGTGLGLPICSKLLQMLGGSLAIDSEPGHGSTFTAAFHPGDLAGVTRVDPDAPAANPDAGRSADAASPEPLQGLRVLLAEDGPDNQKLIGLHLRRAGADVAIADNGLIAVNELMAASAGDTPFDLVFMDMQMPELDGYGATGQLRQLGFRLPVVALTAHAMSGDRDKCLAAGCDDYLTKPVNKAALVDACLRWTAEAPQAAA
ncbi:MAG: ATP-binding protein [Planctomycetota bacterium]